MGVGTSSPATSAWSEHHHVLNPLWGLFTLIVLGSPPRVLTGKNSFWPHIIDGDTKAQRGQGGVSREAEQGQESRPVWHLL